MTARKLKWCTDALGDTGPQFNIAKATSSNGRWSELEDSDGRLVHLKDCTVAEVKALFSEEFPGAGVVGRTRAGMVAALGSGDVNDAPSSSRRGNGVRNGSVTVGRRNDAVRTKADPGTKIGKQALSVDTGEGGSGGGPTTDEQAEGSDSTEAAEAGDTELAKALSASIAEVGGSADPADLDDVTDVTDDGSGSGSGESGEGEGEGEGEGGAQSPDEDLIRRIAREEDENRPLPAVKQLAEAVGAVAGVTTNLDKRVTQVDKRITRVDERLTGALASLESARPRVEAIKIADHEAQPMPKRSHPILSDLVHVLTAVDDPRERLHAYLVGPAGTGKSFACKQAAELMDVPFSFMSWGPTTPITMVNGYKDANGNYHRTPFREVWEHGGLFLFDEVDNGHPGLVTNLNNALSNGHHAFPDGLIEKSKSAYFACAANTYGRGASRDYVGTNALNGAFLDRFEFLTVDYCKELEDGLVEAYANGDHEQDVRDWYERVLRVRTYCRKNRVPFIVSMRASLSGAKLIASGMKPDRVAEVRLLDRCDDEDFRSTLEAL